MKKYLLLFFIVQNSFAINLGYYIPGVQGIRDIEQPQKGWGIYWYNSFYNSHQLNNIDGNEANWQIYTDPIGVEVESYITFPYFYWMPGIDFLGGSLGFSINLVIGTVNMATYHKNNYDVRNEQSAGVGDIALTPFILAYDLKDFYGIFQMSVGIPVSKFKSGELENVGLGYWAFIPQLGGIYYFGKEDKNALMLFVTFEFKSDTKNSPNKQGSTFTVETGWSHFFTQKFSAGINLYYQTQMFPDEGRPEFVANWKQSNAALGGELNYWFKPAIWGITIRYNWEFMAKTGFQGANTILNLYYNH